MASTLPLDGNGDITQNSSYGADGLYKLANASGMNGFHLYIEGSNGDGTNKTGGNIYLKPGNKTGTGSVGRVQITAPAWSTAGDKVDLTLGDQNHVIRAIYGTGIQLRPHNGGDGMVLEQDSGNVGINDTSPGSKLDVNGDINTTDVYKVDGTQVVSNRRTGWTDQTATASRANLGGTPTVAQLASFCRALYDDLKAHGLIGN